MGLFERFSIERLNTKTRVVILANHKRESKFEADTGNYEKACEQATIGFRLNSYWLILLFNHSEGVRLNQSEHEICVTAALN